MSGGHFDYVQFRLNAPICLLEDIIDRSETGAKDEHGDTREFDPPTIEKFRLTLKFLRLAKGSLHRVDWLVSGDDSEERFHRRWKEGGLPETGDYNNNNNNEE